MSSWVGDGCADANAALLRFTPDERARAIQRRVSQPEFCKTRSRRERSASGVPGMQACDPATSAMFGATTLPGIPYACSAGGASRPGCFGSFEVTEYFPRPSRRRLDAGAVSRASASRLSSAGGSLCTEFAQPPHSRARARAPRWRVRAAGLRHTEPAAGLAMEATAQDELARLRRDLPLLNTVITLPPPSACSGG